MDGEKLSSQIFIVKRFIERHCFHVRLLETMAGGNQVLFYVIRCQWHFEDHQVSCCFRVCMFETMTGSEYVFCCIQFDVTGTWRAVVAPFYNLPLPLPLRGSQVPLVLASFCSFHQLSLGIFSLVGQSQENKGLGQVFS